MKWHHLISLGATLIVASCSTISRENQAELKKHLIVKNYSEAANFANSERFLNEKKDELLRLLERGRVNFLDKNYILALSNFDKAQELSQQLFTISLSKKASTILTNDNSDIYYGETFEKSMIRFYQSYCHLLLFINGEYGAYKTTIVDNNNKVQEILVPEKKFTESEKRFHLMAAKSVLLEWDSYLNSIKAVTGGEVTFKDDLLAKLFGAFVHENTGEVSDIRIARDLYSSARELLLKNYDIYRAYNHKYLDFRKDFSKLSTMPIADVEKKYIEKTELHKNLLNYIDARIKNIDLGKKNNFLFVLEDGFVSEKKAKQYSVPLSLGGSVIVSSNNRLGDSNFINFSLRLLGLSGATEPRIYFELPEVDMGLLPKPMTLLIESRDGKFKKNLELQIVNPLNEIAHQALDEKNTGLQLRTGTRVAGKQLAALLTAYGIYMNQKEANEFFAMSLATISYVTANKTIEISERADLRSWQSLPDHLKLSATDLPLGDYILKIKTENEIKNIGEIKIDDLSKVQVFNLHL